MNFEQNKALYPDRPSENLDASISTLKKIETGEFPKINLSEKELSDLLVFEDGLGEEFEKIYSPTIPSITFYLEYFLTPEGRFNFEKICHQEIIGETEEEVKKFLLKNRSLLKNLKPAERMALSGKAETFSDEKILAQLLENYKNGGNIADPKLKAPEKLNILTDSQRACEKISALRLFRNKLKILLQEQQLNKSAPAEAKKEVLLLYKRRANEILAELFNSFASVHKIKESLGMEALDENENWILKLNEFFSPSEKNFSRYDKFIHGATKESDSQGMKKQIGQEILSYAKKVEKEYLENAIRAKNLAEAKGLDYIKICNKNISCEDFQKMANESLDHYGLKSSLPEKEYSPDRPSSAPDGKWQFIARPEYKVMSVDGKQKILKSGTENKNIIEALSVLCGHEMSHVLQQENKSKLPLRLFKKIGGGRSQIFSEGGAMFSEDFISQKLFGFKNVPHAHYIAAMHKKLEGGNYLDCVKAFFESSQKSASLKKEWGIFENEEDFLEATKENLKTAINRCKRLFHSALNLNESSPTLTRSKETVYLEQLILLEKLSQAGLEKFAYISGANLQTLISLGKLNLLQTSEIKAPDFYALEIWNQIKDSYKKE